MCIECLEFGSWLSFPPQALIIHFDDNLEDPQRVSLKTIDEAEASMLYSTTSDACNRGDI